MKIYKLFSVLLVAGVVNAEDRPLKTYDPTHTPVTGYKEYISEHPKTPAEVKGIYKTQKFYKSKQNKFFIIVNSSLYSSISTSIDQYVADLEGEGYTVNIYQWSGGTEVTLKAFLQDSSEGLVGVVFIGNLPIAWYELDGQTGGGDPYEDFPCDLFYMDLDGEWTDTNPTGNCQTGVWDGHSDGTGDVYPEIFVGRLYVSPSMGTESTLLNKYFAKAHKYRTGGFASQIKNRALDYTDDDWAYSFNWATTNAYDSVVVVNDYTTTCASDYRDSRLTENYAWINLACHSNATKHYFGPGGSGQGTVSYSDVKNKKPLAHFYSLYCCSNCRFTEGNCMGSWYVLVDSCGLGASGSCKTGGMYNPSTLFESLGNYKCYGEALKDWWTASLPCSEGAKSYFYGLTLLGDPALVPIKDYNIAPYVPNHPSPANSAVEVPPVAELIWSGGDPDGDSVTYDVYFEKDDSSPDVLVSDDRTDTTYTTEPMYTSSVYYWQVIAKDEHGKIATGPVWSFTTASSGYTLVYAEDFEDPIGGEWSTYRSNTSYGRNERTSDYYQEGAYGWRMDVTTGGGMNFNLNEITLNIFTAGATKTDIKFYTMNGDDDENTLPTSWSNHYDGDGWAVSGNGTNWYKIQNYPYPTKDTWQEYTIDLTSACSAHSIPLNNCYVRWQQYDNYPIDDDGIVWDNIRVYSDGVWGIGVETGREIENTFMEISSNPFAERVIIRYALSKPAHTTLKIYDISGKLVKALVDEKENTGEYSINWDGKETQGKQLLSGVYFIRFQAGNYKETKKIVLLK